jgi:hypothetical protein
MKRLPRNISRLINYLVVVVLLSSCSTYQYVSIHSDQPADQSGKFVFENDTVRVSHEFSGLEGPATVAIKNKLTIPIHVSWESSAILLEEQTLPEVRKDMLTINDLDSGNIRWRMILYDSINKRYSSPAVTTISSASEIISHPIYLSSQFLKSPRKDITSGAHGDSLTYETYSPADSPLMFRSRVVVGVPGHAADTIDQKFWAGKVVTGPLKPRERAEHDMGKNVYFVRRTTRQSEVGGAVAILGLIIVLSVLVITD